MRITFLITVLTIGTVLSSFAANYPPADYLEAVGFCDNQDLRPIEGLWTYPEDDVTVLIYRSKDKKGVYDIYVVESADCSLQPEVKLGELTSSADPDKYTLRLFTSIRKGILINPCSATATFSQNKESLSVKRTGINIRINPLRLLPSFWRIASFSIKTNDAAPKGMIKIYPSYDGNGSSKRIPRYL